jgi:3-oxoacyl-[acyl-carrier-protein] synthase-1/3-oxoacyl-[acyl-carrier-protein] synthase II
MSQRPRAYVTGIGVVCAGANNVAELRALLAAPKPTFGPSSVFPSKTASAQLPVAEVVGLDDTEPLPRTHRLALQAAREALAGAPPPDAIVLGTTTGGILATEAALQVGVTSPEAYRYHGLDTVARTLAETFDVRGPVITISTACSSAAVAFWVASALLRAGLARRVLAGGADSLCRLTFHGFRQLQLVAPSGTTPLDINRAGMTVGEGAGFLLLEKDPENSPVLAVLAGAGLSCDAFHATSPHPEGAGAVLAMQRALSDADVAPAAIDYINLHGTGTPDNDAAEARAVKQVFGDAVPTLSSTKGLTGHALAASGGIEAVVSVLALTDGLVPANTGLITVDPKLGLDPVSEPRHAEVRAVLSNSFGFGGNNACLVLQGSEHGGRERTQRPDPTIDHPATSVSPAPAALSPLRIAASACLSTRGGLDETWTALVAGEPVAGFVPDASFTKLVPPALLRRLKRLPRMTLALASQVYAASTIGAPPEFIAFGTAWGPLAETQDFLRKLFETDDKFSSPTDFVGSVHNAPAGQIALLLGARAPNLTCSSAERSFEHALLCASLGVAAGAKSALVVAAEAFEARLSPLFDSAVASGPLASDGGAAFLLLPDNHLPGPRIRWLGEFGRGENSVWALAKSPALAVALASCDAIALGLAGETSARQSSVVAELTALLAPHPVVVYRERLGHHASVSATAAALVAHGVVEGFLPLTAEPLPLPRKRVLMLQLGPQTTAFEVFA